ncbi:MAG TPA: glycoside hydrolase family 3 N-terminal domain-containing protein [Solirubrobacterales bacterium]|jgi:beta-N-acetylhexosaminidase|nr:glycoside hydrolase family 3 N-terminal domain-containing protein [Solirubrobacterales bacterium]
MERSRVRRRRVALGALAGLAIAAFAFGAALGDTPTPEVEIEVASTLPVPRLVGERIVAGVNGTDVSPALESAIREGRVAGVVLFADNFPSRAAGRRLIASLQGVRRPPALRDPLLVMIDQEGGLVKRVGGPPTASAREMGERGAAFSRDQGRRTAANLREVGVNVDLAPVLDVARPGGTIAATERGFGASAERVAATAVPFAVGLRGGGVAATGKHFPGLGAAPENTDFAVQRIGLSKQALRDVDEAPYRAFSAAGGDLVMLSTAIYPALSADPAAFSRAIATGELRSRLGFEGVSITDALDSVAVEAFGGPAKAGIAAARAGSDLLLFTDLSAAERAWRALAAKLRHGALDREEFEAAAQRVLDLRRQLTAR